MPGPALEELAFTSLPRDQASRWRRPASLAFVGALTRVPISDTELLQTSHYLPVAIEDRGDELQVVAVTASHFQRAPLLSEAGQWQRSYVPVALRCLPFRVTGDDGAAGIEMTNAFDSDPGADFPLFQANGSLAGDVQGIAAMLRRFEHGKRRLKVAAEQLFLAGLLTQLQVRAPANMDANGPEFLTVDAAAYRALPNARLALLVQTNLLALDLIASCLFSQRLMPQMVSVRSAPERDVRSEAGEANEAGATTHSIIPTRSALHVDSSELFSFEMFDAASRHGH